VFGHRPRLAHSHQADRPHPLRRQAWITVAIASLLAIIALLLLPPHAHGNFVYWTNDTPGNSIGRAKINGTGLNDNFITGLNRPIGVAVDSKYIYWADWNANRIGRANLDGTSVNLNFITGVHPEGIAVTGNSGIFWGNDTGTSDTIGHANIDGSNPNINFAATGSSICGIAADQSFVYWLDNTNSKIGRVPLSGTTPDPNFQSVPSGAGCGLAVDGSFLYWSASNTSTLVGSVGRVPVGGGTPDENFIPNATSSVLFRPGPAVNSQYVFWSNASSTPGAGAIGRANINGSSPNPNLIAGVAAPNLLAAAPSNKITVNSITKKKKKGTATINAKVPGPGQITLNQTSTPPDVNATAAAIKQVGLTITQASSFKLPVKPKGKTAKKLKKQVKKKGKGKVKQTVFIHFVPAGVAGVPNTKQVTVTLVKQGKKKK
jgi:Low-density lipoprotein receptor repeat class B